MTTWYKHQHRTANDGITFEGEASGGGGGGSGGVQVVTVPVSSAEILDLFNTPVVLIPGVAGKVTTVNGVVIAYIAGLVPYLDGGGGINIGAAQYGTLWGGTNGAGLWDQATSRTATQGYGNGSTTPIASTSLAGADVILSEDTASPTLGDGTLLVTLSYFLAPTV